MTAYASNLNQNYSGGTLTQQGALPRWPARPGCIKVTYTAGYNASGSPAVPADLTQAVLSLANFFYITRKSAGQLYQSETLSKYTYSLRPTPGGSEPPEIGSVRSLLSRYREVAF
jgi:hypothetical protein